MYIWMLVSLGNDGLQPWHFGLFCGYLLFKAIWMRLQYQGAAVRYQIRYLQACYLSCKKVSKFLSTIDTRYSTFLESVSCTPDWHGVTSTSCLTIKIIAYFLIFYIFPSVIITHSCNDISILLPRKSKIFLCSIFFRF